MSHFDATRRKFIFNPTSREPFKVSRSKIDLFMECPRCFYLDARHGVSRVRGPSFTLNVAVDALLKKEFDVHRAAGTTHPLMKAYGLDLVPFQHPDMDIWRENFKGVQYLYKPANILVTGAVDDVWVNKVGELIVVDYKATAKQGRLETLSDTTWERQYRRQMEIYQWLLRQNGFNVSSTGYFLYVNGKKDAAAFDGKLEFETTLIPHNGDDSWIEKSLMLLKHCLVDERLPEAAPTCEHCQYLEKYLNVLRNRASKKDSTTTKPTTKPKKNPTKKSKTTAVTRPEGKLFDM